MIGSLFSGYGGLDMAAEALGFGPVAWHCELEPAPSRLLAYRYPTVPNLGDITAADWTQVEPVDVLTGGFPCQDISNAGKHAGITGTRSGLWSHYADAVRVLRPRLVLVENVSALVIRGLDRVIADLSALGYDARWGCVRASDTGAPHRRERVFIIATHTTYQRHELARGTRGRRLGLADSDGPSSHAEGVGWAEGRTESTRLVGRPDTAVSGAAGAPTSDPDNVARDGKRARARSRHGSKVAADAPRVSYTHEPDCGNPRGLPIGAVNRPSDRDSARQSPAGVFDLGRAPSVVAWGPYAAAITRWEHVTGRPSPRPTELGARGRERLSPRFVEWMMGLPAGWVTAVPGLTRNEQLKMLGNGVVPHQAIAAYSVLLARDVAA